ncbi:MAG: P-II family nitrogen regulator [Calditrichaeota bacterium]|nr:MAG: P-II family nitrogen regulator [Calditrichota bacterium]
MKEIKAIIQPFLLTKVVDALKKIDGLPGLTVDSDVRGFGRSRASEAKHKIIDDIVEYAPKAKLEIVVPDDMVEITVETILEHAHTGNPGDGKIFIINVEDVIKIRTKQRGEQAL